MKKSIKLFLALILCLSLVGCNGVPSASSTPDPAVSDEQNEFEELLSDIVIEMDIDQVLSQAVVTITNNSSMIFDGTVHVHFKNSEKKSVGDDSIFVESLASGNGTYARISISEADNIEMTYSIGDYTFTEGYSSDSGTLDEDISQSLANDFEGSFGGAGNPEWATSWYGYVTKIEVFSTDTNRYAVITVNSDADADSIGRIGNAIFGNYSVEYELARVLVRDTDGNNVFDKSA